MTQHCTVKITALTVEANMNTYIVACANLYENINEIEIVYAENKVDAMLASKFCSGMVFLTEDEECIKEIMFNGDFLIEAMEVNLCQCHTE